MKCGMTATGLLCVLAVLLAVCGCGGGGSDGDGGGVNPTGPTTEYLVIHSPNGTSMFYGEELFLSVTGGSGMYYWSLQGDQPWAKFDLTRTAPDGSSTYLVASDYLWGVGPSQTLAVQVRDSADNWGMLNVKITDMIPTVSPPKATVPLDIVPRPTIKFEGSGGTPPFYWTVDKPYLASIVQDSSGSNFLVQPLAAGRLTITLFDAKNLGASAVLDIIAGSPKIVPVKVTLSLGESITFRASQGTPPYYDWHLSDPSVGALEPPLQSWKMMDEAVFTAYQLGTTQVILEDDNGQYAFATVEIIQAQTMIVPSKANLLPGEELILTAKYGISPYFFFNGDQGVGALEKVSFNQVRFTALYEGITVIRLEDGRGQQDTCTIFVSKAFQIYPLSVKGKPQQTVVFFLYGGSPPYQVLVTDSSVGQATIQNGSEVHFKILALQQMEDTSYPGILEVYDAHGLRVAAEVTVAGAGCEIQVEPVMATARPGESLKYLVLCGVEPYQVTVMDATVIDMSSLTVSGNVITMKVAEHALEGSYPGVVRIWDGNNQEVFAGVEVTYQEFKPLTVTPTSASGAPEDILAFVVSGGSPPYTAQVTNSILGTPGVNGNAVTLSIGAGAPDGAAGLLLVQDSSGDIASVSITVTVGAGP